MLPFELSLNAGVLGVVGDFLGARSRLGEADQGKGMKVY